MKYEERVSDSIREKHVSGYIPVFSNKRCSSDVRSVALLIVYRASYCQYGSLHVSTKCYLFLFLLLCLCKQTFYATAV